MSIAGDLIRGHTEAVILARLLRGDSYGYEINKAVSSLSGGRFELNEATLYTAFRRLEEGGFIASYWGDGGAGARRRYYTITASGREEWKRLLREWEETKEIMDHILKEEEKAHERQADCLCGSAVRRCGPGRENGGNQSGNFTEHPG